MKSRSRLVYDILVRSFAAGSSALFAAVARAQTAAVPSAADTPAPAAAPAAATFHPLGEWLRAAVPAGLRKASFLLENWQWLGLAAAILLGWVASRIIAAILSSTGRRVFERFVPGGDVGTVRRTASPFGLLLGAGVTRFGFRALGLPKEILDPLVVATGFVGAAAAVLTAYRLVDLLTAHFAERARRTPSRYDDLLVPLLRKSLKIVVIAFGVVFVADNLDVDISSLLTGLGLGGLAFALAAQDTVKNLFGSLTVLLDKPFQVGDAVRIGDVEGTVEEVGLRSTRVRTSADSLVTVPNANLISSNVENLGARRRRRWQTRLGVEYGTPPETIESLCEGIRDLVRRNPDIHDEDVEIWANEFGASSIEILVSLHFAVRSWSAELAARHRLLLDILRLAEKLRVPLALPAQTLHLRRGDARAR
ncbi:MAG: mechanosensitive ion channel family protein [bacterium]